MLKKDLLTIKNISKMKNLISELLSQKAVLVPFAMVCTFVLECEREGIDANGGAFEFEHREITGQYFYL